MSEHTFICTFIKNSPKMKPIQEIINDILLRYPEAEILRNVMLSDHFIADYLIIKDFEIKAIFTSR